MKSQYTIMTEDYYVAKSVLALVDFATGDDDNAADDAIGAIHFFLDDLTPLSRIKTVDDEVILRFVKTLRGYADDIERFVNEDTRK